MRRQTLCGNTVDIARTAEKSQLFNHHNAWWGENTVEIQQLVVERMDHTLVKYKKKTKDGIYRCGQNMCVCVFRVRLRKKTWKNPGTVFLDYHVYEEDISIPSNWEVFLEVLNGNAGSSVLDTKDIIHYLFFWYWKHLLEL